MKYILIPLSKFLLRVLMTIGMLFMAYPIIIIFIILWNFRLPKESEISVSRCEKNIFYPLQSNNEHWIKRYCHGQRSGNYTIIKWTTEFHYIWGYPPNNLSWPSDIN